MGRLKLLAGSAIVLIFVAVVCSFIGFIFMGFESAPLVPLDRQLKQEDIGRIMKIIEQNDPRELRDGQVKKVTITQEELNLLLDYTLVSLGLRIGTRVGLGSEFTLMEISMALSEAFPGKFIGRYLNLSAKLAIDGREIALNRMTVGKLPVPVFLVNPVMALGYHWFESFGWFKPVKDVMDSIRTIEPGNKEVTVEFQWDRGVAKRFQNQARDLIVSPSDKERIKFYSGEIVRLSHLLEGSSVSLAAYFKPLFLTALERSERGEPAKSENRAVIFSLALYAMNWSDKILTQDHNFPSGTPALAKAVRRSLTLGGRDDLAKHFLISATISAGSNSGLSSVVGVFKEMEDSRGGTGFSFADLAADRAGIEFAKLATEQDDTARTLQRIMAQILDESEFMPPVDHLPEGIMELEFKRRFRDLDSREYALVEGEINQRIAGCKLYKNWP